MKTMVWFMFPSANTNEVAANPGYARMNAKPPSGNLYGTIYIPSHAETVFNQDSQASPPGSRATAEASVVLPTPGLPVTRSGRRRQIAVFTIGTSLASSLAAEPGRPVLNRPSTLTSRD
jgi:hypothetical protein